MHGVGELQVRKDSSFFHEGEESFGGRNFEAGCCLGDIGIPHDDVHAPIEFRISVGFIAGVDHGSGPRGRRRDSLPHLVGALGELIANLPVFPAVQATGSRYDLPGHEEGDEPSNALAVVRAPVHHVVFVAAERMPL